MISVGEVKANTSTMTSIKLQMEQYLKACDTGNGSAFLGDYSPWLISFSGQGIADIEIPGQYDGFSPPDPERHVKIYEFYSKVILRTARFSNYSVIAEPKNQLGSYNVLTMLWPVITKYSRFVIG